MKKRVFVSAVYAVAMAVGVVTMMHAQDGPARGSLPCGESNVWSPTV